MTILDILYLILALGFLVIVSSVVFLTVKISRTMDMLKLLLEDFEDTTKDIRGLKNSIKLGFLSTASILLRLIFGKRGGDYNV
ncbi:MAG: hypothetical protein ACD_50C00309G0012 [uncultured bacterium]|nr:MAG: hypothetical protein ACD_50C00309G0012 [uncultured bacterium]OGH13181.1 MAG: hypothetical protein A2687_05350 [Candidatus Levybacteria bacterium RIFCSPHIGHO2_01_FULL_38_26]